MHLIRKFAVLQPSWRAASLTWFVVYNQKNHVINAAFHGVCSTADPKPDAYNAYNACMRSAYNARVTDAFICPGDGGGSTILGDANRSVDAACN